MKTRGSAFLELLENRISWCFVYDKWTKSYSFCLVC